MVTPLDIQLGSESLTIQKNIKIWLRTPMVGNTIGDALTNNALYRSRCVDGLFLSTIVTTHMCHQISDLTEHVASDHHFLLHFLSTYPG